LEPESIGDLLRKRFEGQPSYMSHELLPKGGKSLLFGFAKAGKSLLSIQLALSLSTGAPFLGRFLVWEPVRVLYWQNEIALPYLRERIDCISKTAISGLFRDNFWHFPGRGVFINTPSGQEEIVRVLKKVRPQVLIFDNLSPGMIGDVRAWPDVQSSLRVFDMLLSNFPLLHVLVVHHEGKRGEFDRGFQAVLGSVHLLNWPDSLMRLRKEEGGQGKLEFELRHAEAPPSLPLQLQKDTLTFRALKPPTIEAVTQELVRRERKPTTRGELLRELTRQGISSLTRGDIDQIWNIIEKVK